MTKQYEIKRVVDITTPNGGDAVFYEVREVFDIDGEERSHRNADLAFKTVDDAQAWIDKKAKLDAK